MHRVLQAGTISLLAACSDAAVSDLDDTDVSTAALGGGEQEGQTDVETYSDDLKVATSRASSSHAQQAPLVVETENLAIQLFPSHVDPGPRSLYRQSLRQPELSTDSVQASEESVQATKKWAEDVFYKLVPAELNSRQYSWDGAGGTVHT